MSIRDQDQDHPAFVRAWASVTEEIGDQGVEYRARVAEYRATPDYAGGFYVELWCLDTEECLDEGRSVDEGQRNNKQLCRDLIEEWREELEEGGV